MDSQRPVLYLSLLFMIFLIWTTWKQDHAPQPMISTASSVTAPATPVSGSPDVPAQTSTPALPNVPPANVAATGSEVKGQVVTVHTDTLDFHISTQGGEILEADLPTYPMSLDALNKPTRILDLDGSNYVAQSGLQHQAVSGQDTQKLAPDHKAIYQVAQTDYTLAAGQDTLVVPLTWQGADGITVTKRYTFRRGSFLVDVEHEVKNGSNQAWDGTEYRQLKHGPAPKPGGMFSGFRAYIGAAYYDKKYQRLPFNKMESANLNETVDGGWVSMLEHYFLSAWIPPKGEQGQFYTMVTQDLGNKAYIIGVRSPVKQIAPGATGVFKSQFYVGPTDQGKLATISDGLDLTVDYGIFAFVSKPIFWLMKQIHHLVGNWGWTIILLTILIKGLFFYPSAMSYKSMAKMKAVSPRLKELNERFADDPQGKQKAMMEIYRKEKINPLGGCLPVLIQMPVFMGLYWVLQESVELRQAPWLLWYKDLSIMDPYYVLPLIMGASMFLQQKLNPPQADPMQQKIFQFMPIIFTVMFLSFPAGLVLYWVVNNILSISQQWFINKKIIKRT